MHTTYAFRTLGLEKILTLASSGNEQSRRALKRDGYKQCAPLRWNRFFHGRWHDEWLGEILRDEWEVQQIEKNEMSATKYCIHLLKTNIRNDT